MPSIPFPVEDGSYDISLSKVGARRSNPANRFYWKVVIPKVAECLATHYRGAPVSAQSAHEFCKAQFASDTYVDTNGKTFFIPHSTRKMDKTQFTNYLNQIEFYLWEQFQERWESQHSH